MRQNNVCTTKKHALILTAIILISAIMIGCLFVKNRFLAHLAIWQIKESKNITDFYWGPENAPDFFYFEKDSDLMPVFSAGIKNLIIHKTDDFEKTIEIAKHVNHISNYYKDDKPYLKWGSPYEMLSQIKSGRRDVHCFHRSILFSSYLSSIGIKSRLWALENQWFNDTAHTIPEVYIPSLKKWVLIDVMFDFYAESKGIPLSFLEFREILLNNSDKSFSMHKISNSAEPVILPKSYNTLVKCVFLRTRNDFIKRYTNRYGVLSIFQNQIDNLPNSARIGAEYLFGRQDVFIHYVDRFSRSLKAWVITIKLLFYFLALSILILAGLAVYLLINLSKKDTRHT